MKDEIGWTIAISILIVIFIITLPIWLIGFIIWKIAGMDKEYGL